MAFQKTITVSTRGMVQPLKQRLEEVDQNAEAYVLGLIQRDLGIATASVVQQASHDMKTGPAWRPIPSTEGKYEASRHGKIRNADTHQVISPQEKKRGLAVHLQLGGLTVTKYVRRLVAEAFLGPIPRGYWVVDRGKKPSTVHLRNLVITTAQGAGEMERERRAGSPKRTRKPSAEKAAGKKKRKRSAK